MIERIDEGSTKPPAQPTYILRGHNAQIHAARFARQNTRLITGDADGWVVVWNLPIKRAAAVWKAHSSTVLSIEEWHENIITHGRDGKLYVWQLAEQDENSLSTTLPIDDQDTPRPQPWLHHSVLVHALNFCSIAICPSIAQARDSSDESKGVLVAVSGVTDGTVVLLTLPDEKRVSLVPIIKGMKTGMLMAIGLLAQADQIMPLVITGYESGHVAVWRQNEDTTTWQYIYIDHTHSQPVMSLAVAEHMQAFFSSSADAIIASHSLRSGEIYTAKSQTKHAGQQSLQVRSDERIFATAGWDHRIRVYSTRNAKELAVLKWHKEGSAADDQDDHSRTKTHRSDTGNALAGSG